MSLETAVKALVDQGLSLDDILTRVRGCYALSKTLTEKDLIDRNYTYVTCWVLDPTTQLGCRSEAFLVSSPFKAQAKVLAWKFISLNKWNLKVNIEHGKKRYFNYYPRNYIAKAKKLFAQNKFI